MPFLSKLQKSPVRLFLSVLHRPRLSPACRSGESVLSGHGGALSFELKGSGDETSRFVDALKIPFMGTNFGSPYSMVEQCSVFTFYKQTAQERRSLGISDSLIRYSVGFEPIDVIISDLEQAF